MSMKIALAVIVAMLLVGGIFFLIKRPIKEKPQPVEPEPPEGISEGQVYDVINDELNRAIENISLEDIENALIE